MFRDLLHVAAPNQLMFILRAAWHGVSAAHGGAPSPRAQHGPHRPPSSLRRQLLTPQIHQRRGLCRCVPPAWRLGRCHGRAPLHCLLQTAAASPAPPVVMQSSTNRPCVTDRLRYVMICEGWDCIFMFSTRHCRKMLRGHDAVPPTCSLIFMASAHTVTLRSDATLSAVGNRRKHIDTPAAGPLAGCPGCCPARRLSPDHPPPPLHLHAPMP